MWVWLAFCTDWQHWMLPVEHELHRDTARHADVERHRRVALRLAVRLERGGDRVRRAVRPLDDELVLEHDEVALARLVLHQRLELRAERVEEVACARLDLLAREETDPAHARDDARSLGLVGERAHLFDASDESAIKHRSVGEIQFTNEEKPYFS